MRQAPKRRLTVVLPRDLIQRATDATGLGLTTTIRRGLEALVSANACEWLRKRRGTFKFSINVDQLRED